MCPIEANRIVHKYLFLFIPFPPPAQHPSYHLPLIGCLLITLSLSLSCYGLGAFLFASIKSGLRSSVGLRYLATDDHFQPDESLHFFIHLQWMNRMSSQEWKWKFSRSVVSRLLLPWDFPGNSTGVSCHFLLQRIFPTQESNPGLPKPFNASLLLILLKYHALRNSLVFQWLGGLPG